jgi:hypothetical protein
MVNDSMAITLSVQSILSRIPIPFIYGAAAWIVANVPVYLQMLPSTFDGYSTTGVFAAGVFLIGAAKWIDSEILQYYPSLAGVSPAPSQVSSSQPAPAVPFALAFSATTLQIGSSPVVTVNGWQGSYQLYDNTGTPISAVKTASSFQYNVTADSPLGIDLAQYGNANIYAQDAKGNKSNTITVKS